MKKYTQENLDDFRDSVFLLQKFVSMTRGADDDISSLVNKSLMELKLIEVALYVTIEGGKNE